MAPTLSFVTAALLVAQSPATPAAPSTCPCQKNNANVAQVQYIQPVPAEVAATSGSSTVQNDNHPVLTRIRTFFRGTPKDQTIETQGPIQGQTIVTSEPPVEQKRVWSQLPHSTSPAPATTVMPTSAPIAPVVSPSYPSPAPLAPAALPAAPVKIVTPVSATSPYTAPVNSAMIATPSAPIAQSIPVVTTGTTVTPLPTRPSKISPDLANKVGANPDYAWITGQIRIENGVHVLYYASPETVDRFGGHVVLTSAQDLRSVPEGAHVCVRGSVASQNGTQATYRVQAIDILTKDNR